LSDIFRAYNYAPDKDSVKIPDVDFDLPRVTIESEEELPPEDKYFYKLWNICKKYSNYCTFSFIYDRENLLDLKDSPTDKGEEIFKKLLEKRVKVK
jgi:hypothetical protein